MHSIHSGFYAQYPILRLSIQVYLLIPHQPAQKESCLSFDLVAPYKVLRPFSFRIPGTQKISKAVMKQARLPSSMAFIPLSWTLCCQFIIIHRHPSNRNPVFWLLTLLLVQVENRHCTNQNTYS